MFQAVAQVRSELIKAQAGPEYSLETICRIFTGVSQIDEVEFLSYEVSQSNPIWGEFTRWTYRPAVYAELKNKVLIRYAAHLLKTPANLRFVVCKELCHSLEEPNGEHDVSDRAIGQLVDTFSLVSARERPEELSSQFLTELHAEVCAVELLCPMPLRRAYVAKHGEPDEAARIDLAKQFNIPPGMVAANFQISHMDVIESMFD